MFHSWLSSRNDLCERKEQQYCQEEINEMVEKLKEYSSYTDALMDKYKELQDSL